MREDDIKNPSNRVDQTADRKFCVFWKGQVVYNDVGNIRKFDTEAAAWSYLAHCDVAGRMIE